jgi:glycosyltransferase involved in cell wall biosynthesis
MRHVIQSRSHQPIAEADHIYNVSDVYDRSHRLYRLAGRRTTIDLGGAGAGRRRLWHATTPLPIRVRGTPMLTTVHDLIPLRLPYMTRDHKKTFYGIIDQALRDSCLVLAVSEFTKRDLLELFDVDESKIVVTWETYSPSVPLPESVDQTVVLGQHGLRPHEYLLYVGNVDPRKNLGVLFQAMSAVPCDFPLVIAGRKSDRWDQEIEAAQAHLGVYDQRRLRNRLRLLDYVPAALLQVLYRNALCLVMPSLYEGFGLPVLEAMRHDCPVVCANCTSLPEIAGDAALYFDPESPYELSAQILALAGDKSRRPAMIGAGRAQAARFSPEEYTARVSAAYDQALARVS